MKVSPIPEGFHTVTPYFVVRGASDFLKFLETGLGAEFHAVHKSLEGLVMNAVAKIGDSVVMWGDESRRRR